MSGAASTNSGSSHGSASHAAPGQFPESSDALPTRPRPDPAVLDRLVRELSMRERLVMCLRHADGLTISEIASVLDVGTTEIERVLEHVAARVRLAAGFAAA